MSPQQSCQHDFPRPLPLPAGFNEALLGDKPPSNEVESEEESKCLNGNPEYVDLRQHGARTLAAAARVSDQSQLSGFVTEPFTRTSK